MWWGGRSPQQWQRQCNTKTMHAMKHVFSSILLLLELWSASSGFGVVPIMLSIVPCHTHGKPPSKRLVKVHPPPSCPWLIPCWLKSVVCDLLIYSWVLPRRMVPGGMSWLWWVTNSLAWFSLTTMQRCTHDQWKMRHRQRRSRWFGGPGQWQLNTDCGPQVITTIQCI